MRNSIIGAISLGLVICVIAYAGGFEKRVLIDNTAWLTHRHTSTACSTVYTGSVFEIGPPQQVISLLTFLDERAAGTAARYDSDSMGYRMRVFNSLDRDNYTEIMAVDLDTGSLNQDTVNIVCSRLDSTLTEIYGQFYYATMTIWSVDSAGVADTVTDSIKVRGLVRGVVF